jgi:ABC-2 type transport system ATP-binding protein
MTAHILARDVGVQFSLDRQQRPVTSAMRRLRRRCTTTWGLRSLNLGIGPGEGVALVGPNGAGKTTLLRLMAGVLAPDEGEVVVHGRVGSLLSVDAGLMTLLTGHENAMLLGILAGLSREQARAALPFIHARSELGNAFTRPVSTYSQGMRARLGFAVIERTDPTILLLDEVHEALDDAFRETLVAKAREIRNRGGLIVAAGHHHAELGRLCDRWILLDRSGSHEIDPSDLDELDAIRVQR